MVTLPFIIRSKIHIPLYYTIHLLKMQPHDAKFSDDFYAGAHRKNFVSKTGAHTGAPLHIESVGQV